ncbi:MAG: hypothetical protein ACR2FY_23685 [Pirellulaceae bacterium]
MSDSKTPLPPLWRMAASAASAAVQYAASGFQTVPQEAFDSRLKACDGCSQREGNRCLLCGCFLDKKAWLPFEDCPLGKWPV